MFIYYLWTTYYCSETFHPVPSLSTFHSETFRPGPGWKVSTSQNFFNLKKSNLPLPYLNFIFRQFDEIVAFYIRINTVWVLFIESMYWSLVVKTRLSTHFSPTLQDCEMVTLRNFKHKRSHVYDTYLEINAFGNMFKFRIHI